MMARKISSMSSNLRAADSLCLTVDEETRKQAVDCARHLTALADALATCREMLNHLQDTAEATSQFKESFEGGVPHSLHEVAEIRQFVEKYQEDFNNSTRVIDMVFRHCDDIENRMDDIQKASHTYPARLDDTVTRLARENIRQIQLDVLESPKQTNYTDICRASHPRKQRIEYHHRGARH